MTTQKKNNFQTIGIVTGALIGVCTLIGITWGALAVPQIKIIASQEMSKGFEMIIQRLDKVSDKMDQLNERMARHEGKEEK